MLQDHPKDTEFLNTHLVNFLQMQNIFGSGGATGWFAMGSTKPLGEQQGAETIDLDVDAPKTPVGNNTPTRALLRESNTWKEEKRDV